MRVTALASALLLGLVATVAARPTPSSAPPATIVAQVQDTAAHFPHRRHAGLFPQCTVCHRGVPAGDSATMGHILR